MMGGPQMMGGMQQQGMMGYNPMMGKGPMMGGQMGGKGGAMPMMGGGGMPMMGGKGGPMMGGGSPMGGMMPGMMQQKGMMPGMQQMRPPMQQQQQRAPAPAPAAAAPAQGQPFNASTLAAAPPAVQKQMLGEKLYPAIAKIQPEMAGKVTGMMLEMDNSELLMLLESEQQLRHKVNEALQVLGGK